MPFSDAPSLQAALNSGLNPGDIVRAAPNIIPIDLSILSLPLIIPSGVILEGDYDPIINPGGTHIFTTTRVDYSNGIEAMHMFVMEDGQLANPTTIRKLNISGPCWNWQDFNSGPNQLDIQFRSGICMKKVQATTTPGQYYLVEDCELWGFSNNGIWSLAQTQDITINRCYFHHIKGYCRKGIAYGIWFQSGNVNPSENLVVTNCVFDECKAAIDGQGYDYEWEISDCSLTQYMFSDDINGHDQTAVDIIHPPFGTPGANCQFYDNSTGAGPVNIGAGNYTITDVGGWRTSIQHSIFHRKVLVSGTNESISNINIPYPNTTQSNALVAIQNNTFATPLYPTSAFNRNKGGFSKIADNYIKACVWDADASFIFSDQNIFNYQRNTTIPNSSVPQPPVFNFQLQDLSGNALSQNASGVSFIDLNVNSSGQFKVQLNSTGANQNLRYYLRPNPSKGISNIISNISHSGLNYFFHDQHTDLLNGSILLPYQYENDNNVPLPGLFGIDMMAYHTNIQNTTNTYWSKLHASDWRYQPLIVVPQASTVSPNYIESQLVFHIKDSYQEFNNPALTPTGMRKQVRLNNQVIWEEDIAAGGDGWERISIPFSVLHPILNMNGNNTLSFHIASDLNTAISGTTVKGLIVWADDIYLNNFNDATGVNLITDGSVECATGNGSCNWIFTDYYNTGCVTAMAPPAGSDEDFTYYPDGAKFISSSTLYSKADFSNIDRKSGQYSIQLVLPNLPTSCSTVAYNSANGIFITAHTQFVLYTPFCENYANLLVNNYGQGSTTLNSNYDVNDDFDVQSGQTITFQNCSLAVAAGKQIRVQTGGVLNIENSTLFSCGHMWKGIINEGGVVNVNQGTKINDAIEAVRSDNGYEVNINASVFSNNYISVSLNDGNYSTSEFAGNTFNSPAPASQVLKSPYSLERTYAGISVSNVTDLTLGSSFGNQNVFYHAKYGVYTLNSDIIFYRNLFKFITVAPDHCQDCGVGVYSQVNDGLTHSIEFSGGSSGATRNNFNDEVDYGFVSIGEINLIIRDCIFNYNNFISVKIHKNRNSLIQIENNFFLNAEEKAIVMINNTGCDVSILNNKFTDVVTGIFAQNYAKCDVKIGDNIFNNSGIADVPNFSFHNTAMTLSCYGFDFANIIHIWNNTIDYCRIGIHAENISDIKIGLDPNDIIFKNIINFYFNNPPTTGIYYEGIWLQNCNRPIVVDNEISNITAFNNVPEFRGLDFQSVTNGRINCNVILNMNRSMNFMGISKGTLLRANNMTGYQQAINLDGASMSPQFQVNDITGDQEPLDNVWNDLSNNQGAVTDRVTGNGIPFNWFYQPGVLTGNVFNPLDNGTTSQLIFIQSDISNGVLCTDYTDRQMRDVKFGAVVGDSLEFDEFVDENTYLSKKQAFEAMILDSSILNQNLPSDIAYQDFFNTISSSNIGSFNIIDSLAVDSTLISTALLMNEAIDDTNSIEYYKKEVNRLSIEKVSQDIALSLADSLFLLNTTNMQIPVAGEALFESAAMLCKEVHPTYMPLRLMGSIPSVEIPDSSCFIIYPNPAYAQLNIVGPGQNVNKIEIHSIEGKIIKNYDEFMSPIDISDLQNGNYQLKIFLYNGHVLNHKLSIVK